MTFHIVCGPPCVGKSTFVRTHMRPGDIVLDWDDIVTSLGYHPRQHLVDRSLYPIIAAEWDRRLAAARGHDGDVWIIRAKTAKECRPLACTLGADVTELRAPFDILVERAKRRPEPRAHIGMLTRWHRHRGLLP